MKKFTVCLTGGIASGKTYVSNKLSELGAHVIDADVLSRQVVESGSEGLTQIVDAFGSAVLNQDKTLNRSQLKQLVFKDARMLEKLNSILHPLIRKAFLAASVLNKNELEIWVIPLFEGGEGYQRFDRVLTVDVKRHIQLLRVSSRDQISADLAARIVGSQPSRAARLALSTDVITNNAGFVPLDDSVTRVYGLFKQLTIEHLA